MAKYSQIEGDEKYSSDETESALSESGVDIDPLRWRSIQQTYRNSKKGPWLIIGTLWALSTILTVVTTAFITSKIQACDSLGSLSRGYLSDFAPARTAASSVQRTFTGSPRFSMEKGEYIPSDSPSMSYIGSTPEVDKAWAELAKNRYFLLTDAEAKETWGDGYTEFWNDQRGGYLGGLDMFHTLHCLDHLRKSFYPDKYVLDGIHGEMHQIHCIDHLRQMIQCNSDMTVIPTRFYESINQNYIDSDRTHTCRDFSKVREWASNRYNGELAVKSRHRNGTVWEDYYLPSEVI
ncbi:hypothetical protein F4801DRAFT_559103 [Xylaria longipes]|nr:hypothetical protein F4801DRAFT_559103 [Xylaria longipes]RYC53944.1 hypothetical protein CHU98_g12267 [Xylaria longipes]